MQIYDAHAHVGKDYFNYSIKKDKEFNLPIEKLMKLMKKNKIGKTIVSVCPSIKEITCCLPADIYSKGKKIICKCPKCGKITAKLDCDPYRKYNIKLAREISKLKMNGKIIPFFVIHLQNPFFKEELEFYLKKYKKFGIKLHTFTSKRSALYVKNHFKNVKVPILIHTGHEDYTSPKEIIEFAKEYEGNVLMAHAARLSKKYLNKINYIKNLFVDVAPLTSFYKRILANDYTTILENKTTFKKVNSPEKLYYFLLKQVSYKKLLFGTDAPWCNKFGQGYEQEISIFRNLKVKKNIKEKIAYKNYELFLKNIL
jgi:predicted TIM-barrel fold metal-dependent hydrolase